MRSIRRATGNDATSIEELYRQLDPYASITVNAARLDTLAEDNHTHILVCDDSSEGEIVATAALFLCQDVMFDEQTFAVVENFVVDNHYKREGIGKSLIDFIEAFCLEQNCSKIMFLTDHENRDARDFYTAMGYDPDAKIGFIKHRKYFGQ
jgi:N-acetylglutamate synthase-like GNAT family acetyltransferase